MTRKLFDFLSSFGMMLLGVLLLFSCTLVFEPQKNYYFFHFPASGKRIVSGGDEDFSGAIFPSSHLATPRAKDGAEFAGNLSAVSAVVIDGKTKGILFSKNINEVRPLASVSKLMTAIVLLDMNIDWASSAAVIDADYDGSDHHVNVGERFTLDELWHIALIGSSNTAINALVRSAGFSTEQFAGLMNKKAKELRLFSARFVEPTGLSEKNMANVLDAAKLLRDALLFDKIFTTLQIGEYYAHPIGSSQPRRIWTTNWLLTDWVSNDFRVQDIVGKTGFINDSRYNFTVSLTDKNKHNLIIAIMGAESNEARFKEALSLANWTFDHYAWPEDAGFAMLPD
jgi:D-alanyl-D-alanine carboxypeptidase